MTDEELLMLLGGQDDVEELFAARQIAPKIEKKEEISVLDAKHAYDINSPEDVLDNLARLIDFSSRFFMHLHITFDEKFNDLEQSVVAVLNASIDAKHFRELLDLVDTKASTSSLMILLYFLANTVENKVPHVIEFTEELKRCGSACRVNGRVSTNGYKLNDLASEFEKHFGDDVQLEEGDRFPDVMRSFVQKSLEKFEGLKVKYTSMEVAYKDVEV
ncbi:6711_t:CDS:2 [Ambispora gerdemannii]|uniref:6711_t:CDS:1 n=1 Tax=Ambispora gerdemannii TaxID=144530 RepID=A0A9N9CHU0_9GLOM|nr:6711_t:CDS:2 [Ambispora gerdemannii]